MGVGRHNAIFIETVEVQPSHPIRLTNCMNAAGFAASRRPGNQALDLVFPIAPEDACSCGGAETACNRTNGLLKTPASARVFRLTADHGPPVDRPRSPLGLSVPSDAGGHVAAGVGGGQTRVCLPSRNWTQFPSSVSISLVNNQRPASTIRIVSRYLQVPDPSNFGPSEWRGSDLPLSSSTPR